MEYLVKWEIDIEADSPEEAAVIALDIQRDRLSNALCFTVTNKETKVEEDIEIEE